MRACCLQHVTGFSPTRLLVCEHLFANEIYGKHFADLVDACARSTSPHRLIGHREFWGLRFNFNEHALEPRPDTEALIQAVLDWCGSNSRSSKDLRFADLGTGSGCVAISLLHELPHAHCVAMDINASLEPCVIGNAQLHAVDKRLEFFAADFATAFAQESVQRFDFVVSNPPYIPSGEIFSLPPRVKDHDPILALNGGIDGLDSYRAILAHWHNLVYTSGRLFVEIGYNQAEMLRKIAEEYHWHHCGVYRDITDIERVLEFSV